MSAPIDYSKQVTVGGYLAQRMTHTGLDTFFTVPGDFTLALLDELIAEPKLKMVGCCNELTAGYAADGYCRASGGLGVVVGQYFS
jgi:TPP-dependent 2-oxoacid decarboxylase